MFAPELRAGIVTSVLQDWALPPVDLWAVFPSGRQVSAKARAFVGFIEQEMASAVEFAVTPTGATIDPTDEVADLRVTRRTIPWRPDAMAVG